MKHLLARIGVSMLFITFPIFQLIAQAQSVSGVVTNQETDEAVSYASIFIKGSQIGTISNAEGDFVFYYPDSLAKDTLVISAIGFHAYEILLDTLTQKDSLPILLVPNPYTLDQVLLLSADINPRELVQQAILHIKKNYSRKPYYLKAFFREMSFQDEVYQRLIEAAIGIHDPGIRKNPNRIRIKVQELRKSEDYRELSLLQRGAQLLIGIKYNSLLALISWDPVRNHQSIQDKPWAQANVWLRQAFLDRYVFELTDIVTEGEETYIKIGYSLPDSSKVWEAFLKEGSLLIHSQDYGIRQFEYQFKNNPLIHKTMIGLGDESFLYKLHITYKKTQGIYYPDKIMLTTSGVDGIPFNLDVKRKQNRFAGGLRGTTFLLQVNEVVTNRKQMERIRKKESEKKEVDLYDKDFEYNEAFWAGYNAVPKDRKYISAKEDLERKSSLEQQFQKN